MGGSGGTRVFCDNLHRCRAASHLQKTSMHLPVQQKQVRQPHYSGLRLRNSSFEFDSPCNRCGVTFGNSPFEIFTCRVGRIPVP